MKVYDEEEFLKEVLSIGSINGIDDEREIAKFLAEYLKNCGVDAVVQEIDNKHANVIAIMEGETAEKVIWNGHLDTVPYGKLTDWNTNPSDPVKKNGCIYARGASDMKSGLAAMVYLLGKMKRKGCVPKKTIYFFGTCDEEKNGLGAQKIIEENIVNDASLLLIGEPTGCALGVVQKGCVWLKLKIHGVSSHGAYPWEGINAVEHGVEVLDEFKKWIEEHQDPLLGKSTAQITMIKGGIAANMTPDQAEITIDVRLVPGLSSTDIVRWLEEVCQECTKRMEGKLIFDIEILNDRMAISADQNSPWIKHFEWQMRCEGIKKERMGVNYFTDASIFAKSLVNTTVLLFGPGESFMAHKPNEYVELEKYLKYIKILNRLFW